MTEYRYESFFTFQTSSYGSSDLYDRWEETYSITAQGFDLDFPWMAALVLWERLVPDIISTDKLDDMMQDGYDLLEYSESEASDLWLEVWEHLKKRFNADMKSIEDAEGVFDGTQSLYNWCQDLESSLGNAALKNSSYNSKRIAYCQEFYQLFPETDDSIIENMKRGIGEA